MAPPLRHHGIWKLLLLMAAFVASGPVLAAGPVPESSSEGQQVGKVISVRKVLSGPGFVTRYPRTRYYTLYIAVQASNQTYCAEYETPVLEEIDDAFFANGKNVETELKGKRFTVTTPKGFKLKAHLVDAKQC